ncbi:MAG: tetratricopeptide repeat protein [Oculatellaceae cyanobacterium Prado106]|nr:tetratricopeptide repeat protein [Oculatellaceae cyanobacterium Prado106]
MQTLSFVEVFPDRGHNLHELTRQTLLHQLWEPERPTFLTLSQRLADSFAPDATHQADWIYHLAIANPQQARQEFDRYARHLDHNYRRSESETLFAGLTEHRAAGRLDQRLVGDLAYWEGRLHFRFYEPQIALERYETAIAIYREVGARLGEANTLQAIGDVLQFLDQRTAALERYETAIAIYREVGARLGELRMFTVKDEFLQIPLLLPISNSNNLTRPNSATNRRSSFGVKSVTSEASNNAKTLSAISVERLPVGCAG